MTDVLSSPWLPPVACRRGLLLPREPRQPEGWERHPRAAQQLGGQQRAGHGPAVAQERAAARPAGRVQAEWHRPHHKPAGEGRRGGGRRGAQAQARGASWAVCSTHYAALDTASWRHHNCKGKGRVSGAPAGAGRCDHEMPRCTVLCCAVLSPDPPFNRAVATATPHRTAPPHPAGGWRARRVRARHAWPHRAELRPRVVHGSGRGGVQLQLEGHGGAQPGAHHGHCAGMVKGGGRGGMYVHVGRGVRVWAGE